VSAGVPEESSRRLVQQQENSISRAQFWCEEPACRGIQQNGGVLDQRCQKLACRRACTGMPNVLYVFADFPQVHTVTRFVASEPDELDLEEADVVSVYQKSPDG